MASIHTPSRCGCVLPSVCVHTAKPGSAADTVHAPRDRSSRGASEMSNTLANLQDVGASTLSQVSVVTNAQPSSRPLPLQPAHSTIWLTLVAGSNFATTPAKPSWCIEQSSLFLAYALVCGSTVAPAALKPIT